MIMLLICAAPFIIVWLIVKFVDDPDFWGRFD